MKPTRFIPLLCLLLITSSYAQARSYISLDEKQQVIRIDKTKATIFEKIPAIYKYYVETQSHVINNQEFFIAIQVWDSQPDTQGRCQSGVEVKGYLYQIKAKKLELKNTFLLESCLKDIYLDPKIDGGKIPGRYFSAIHWNNYGFAVNWKTSEMGKTLWQKYSTVFLLDGNKVSIESMPSSVYFYYYRTES